MRISDWSSDVCSSDLSGCPWWLCSSLPRGARCSCWLDLLPDLWPGSSRCLLFLWGALLRWNRALIGAAVAARAGVPDAATAKPRRRHASRWNSAVFAGGSCSHRAPPPVVSCSHENPDNPKCLGLRSEEHTSELQSLMRKSYAVFG